MKSAPNNSALDSFIKGVLKNADANFQPFDWSEVEVLLKHETRSISIGVSKKTILLAAAAIGLIAVLFGIFKLARHYSSLPAESEAMADSTLTTLAPADTVIPAVTNTILISTGTAKTDSAVFYAAEKRKADSLRAVAKADSLAKVKTEVAPVVKIKDKKKKTDTTQKVQMVDTLAPKINVDTITKSVPKAIDLQVPVIPDTGSKKIAPASNGTKKKKSKTKTTPPPPVEQKTDAPVASPDSLK